MLWPHLVNFLLFMPNRREKRTENNPHVSVDIWKRKKKSMNQKLRQDNNEDIKKNLTVKKKKTSDKYLRLWNQLDAIVSPEYGICCSYMTLPSMWPLTFGIWPLLFLTQSPPKGATIQYRPKPVVPPVIFAGGQAYTVPGQMQGVQASEVSQHSPVCGLCVFLFWMEFQIQKKKHAPDALHIFWKIIDLIESLLLWVEIFWFFVSRI